MADDIAVTPGQVTDPKVATDEIAGKHYQKVKFGWGIDGVFSETTDTDGVRLPIGGGQIGALTETVPGTDTASSGLNGRLQRIAQRLTSMIAQLPTTLGQKTMAGSMSVTLASDQPAQPVTGAFWQATQPVSGSVTANAGTNLNTSALVLEANEATRVGIVTETAPGTDTASSGLNGRLQRIAQRLTSLIALLPSSLGQKTMANGLAVTVASDQSAIPVSGSVTANAGTNLNTSALVTETNDATRIGIVTETAPASDTASSGLNGRLQRIAQRLTTVNTTLGTLLTEATYTASNGLRQQASAPMSVLNGQTISAVANTSGFANMGVIVPSTFDGTTISFQVSDASAGTYVPLYDITNALVQMTVTPSRAYDLPGELMVWRYIKIVCGTVQTGQTDFVLVVRS